MHDDIFTAVDGRLASWNAFRRYWVHRWATDRLVQQLGIDVCKTLLDSFDDAVDSAEDSNEIDRSNQNQNQNNGTTNGGMTGTTIIMIVILVVVMVLFIAYVVYSQKEIANVRNSFREQPPAVA